jgi:hypothetical protein
LISAEGVYRKKEPLNDAQALVFAAISALVGAHKFSRTRVTECNIQGFSPHDGLVMSNAT